MDTETRETAQKPPEAKAPEVLRSTSPTVAEYVGKSPQMMSELTQNFISKRGVNDRAKIRQQMKSILDMISVDTEIAQPPKEEAEKKADSYAPRRYDGGRMVDTPDSRMNENILGGTYA